MAKTVIVIDGSHSALMLALKAQDVEVRTKVSDAFGVPQELLMSNGSKVRFDKGGRGHGKPLLIDKILSKEFPSDG